jgi:hypothetical protein
MKMKEMGSGYWRVEFIQPSKDGDDRCVLLHGQLEEVVGPMTMEMAEAWIDRFDNQQKGNQQAHVRAVKKRKSIVPPKLGLPRNEATG